MKYYYKISLIFFFSLIAPFSTYSQSVIGVEWQKEYWDGNNVPFSPRYSGEDWYYGIEISKNASGQENGIVAVGYNTYKNVYPSWGCYTESNDYIKWWTLEYSGHQKGGFRASMSLLNNDGIIQWYKSFVHGEFFNVKQASNGDYIAIGRTKATETINGTALGYNPDSGTPQGHNLNQICSGIDTDPPKVYVVRVDPQGNLVWQYIYGFLDFNATSQDGTNAYQLAAMGWDLVETPSGNFKLVGCTTDPNSNNKENYLDWGGSSMTDPAVVKTKTTPRAFIMEIDGNGKLLWRKLYRSSNYHSIIRGIDKHEFSGNTHYVVAGVEKYIPRPLGNPNQFTNEEIDKNRAFAFMIDDAPNPTPIWAGTYHDNSNATGDYVETKVTDVAFASNGDILLPLVDNSKFYGSAGDGNGYVEIINPSNGIPYSSYGVNTPLPIELCRLKAYDLMVGITPISDGGFAVVSTKQLESLNNIPPPPVGIWERESDPGPAVWNTDAYVAKFDQNAVKEWEKTFDSHSLRPRGDRTNWNYPDISLHRDLKTQECLYQILETDDGLIIGGNTSSNFDDSYIMKLSKNTRVVETTNIFGFNYNELDIDNQSQRNYTNNIKLEINDANVVNESELNLEAYESILIKAGNYIEVESEFSAKIVGETTIVACQALKRQAVVISNTTNEIASRSNILTIFPNPTSTQFTLQLQLQQAGELTASLYNLAGQQVKQIFSQQAVAAGHHTQQIEVADLPAGVYLLQVQTGQEVFTKELVIVR